LQVLDEADTLLAGGFVDDIAFVFGALAARKQARQRVACVMGRAR
jgi:superfamily II DNA/RNA helicase